MYVCINGIVKWWFSNKIFQAWFQLYCRKLSNKNMTGKFLLFGLLGIFLFLDVKPEKISSLTRK